MEPNMCPCMKVSVVGHGAGRNQMAEGLMIQPLSFETALAQIKSPTKLELMPACMAFSNVPCASKLWHSTAYTPRGSASGIS